MPESSATIVFKTATVKSLHLCLLYVMVSRSLCFVFCFFSTLDYPISKIQCSLLLFVACE